MLLSFVCPVAPYHTHLIERARAQVEKQTLPCAFVPYVDTDKLGAGVARNKGVELCSTPYIAFLDCDDYLDPTYAEKTLSVYRPGHYVYTDFLMAGVHVQMSDCSNLKDDDAHHLVTSVISRDIFWQVGGFPTGELEDTRFWARCQYLGVCGIRCPYPLVEYTGEGQRSSLLRQRPGWAREFWDIFREYPSMCNCGKGVSVVSDMGTKYEGDVLVRALWGGNRAVTGRVTHRRYPRSGNGKELWLDPRDAAAEPKMFQVVPVITPESFNPDLEKVQALVASRLKAQTENKKAETPDVSTVSEHPHTVQSKASDHRAASGVQRKPAAGKAASSNRGRRK